MAVTRLRTALGLVLACGALAVALLPPHPPVAPHFAIANPAQAAANRANWALWSQVEALAALERVGPLRNAEHHVSGSPTQPQVQIGPGIPKVTAQSFIAEVRSAWTNLRPIAGTVPVGIALVRDTARTYDGFSRMYRAYRGAVWAMYVLPDSASGTGCYSVVATATAAITPRSTSYLDQLARDGTALGPCALYAMFGRPGPRIGAWLKQGGARLAIAGAEWSQHTETTANRWSLNDHRSLVSELARLSCARGDLTACDNYLRAARGQHGVLTAGSQGGRVVPNFWSRPFESVDGGRILSDLVAARGRDRFAVFWHSRRPVAAAFMNAYGMSLEQWTSQWVRAQVGHPPLPRALHDAAPSFITIIVLLGAAAGIGMRRTVR